MAVVVVVVVVDGGVFVLWDRFRSLMSWNHGD